MPREPTDIRPCGCLTDSQLIASLTITGTARPVLECARLKSANITPAFLVGVRRGVRAGLYPGDGPAAARLVEDSDMDSYIIAPRCYYLAPWQSWLRRRSVQPPNALRTARAARSTTLTTDDIIQHFPVSCNMDHCNFINFISCQTHALILIWISLHGRYFVALAAIAVLFCLHVFPVAFAVLSAVYQ